MTTLEERQVASDKRVIDNISKYGCHVLSIFDPEEKQPNFSYSIGIQETTGAPEVIVVGIRSEMGHSMVMEYHAQVKKGVHFQRGVLYEGFLNGFSIYVETVKPKISCEYTFGCSRYYQDKKYSVVQLVYPTITGVWPWQLSATEWFKVNQPMLGRKRPDRP
jgi:hypothetical protein